MAEKAIIEPVALSDLGFDRDNALIALALALTHDRPAAAYSRCACAAAVDAADWRAVRVCTSEPNTNVSAEPTKPAMIATVSVAPGSALDR